MSVTALIVAAGSGSRMGGDISKQYRKLAGIPVLRRAVMPFFDHPRIDQIRVVISEGQQTLAAEALEGLDVGTPIIGGATRQESVRLGLEALAAEGAPELVLIHDAARPFCPPDVIDRILKALQTNSAAVPSLPAADTLMRGKGKHLGDTVDRTHLNRLQTPQAFHFGRILEAHRAKAAESFTDDATLARAALIGVVRIEGDEALNKLTLAGDFSRAEANLRSQLIPRTGLGFDVHAFAGDGPIMMGGIEVPHVRGLAGHSDADVVLHSITDALLGAAGLGDIGQHFPPDDPQWKDASSSIFLGHAAKLVRGAGGIIDFVDCTVICEEPRVGPHRDAMRSRVAEILDLPRSAVSIKATTTERLGFTGRREGIAAQAVTNIRMPPSGNPSEGLD
ncbi:MAG TPA: bifunctional 2-C-methyl-D-erythritol 4-phosphate cytidylyltransferase/2-C-methyl-D-erythritol 2,4-cyclodiphosphate synthase [Sphingomicrobium sp.]|nr:bifunctional 2-C-methyl-D-erythritol 4-phosphate cytidylyltransferase/2-C-methyl-D-erythritol 2,4-cyclodiphosphate synthase [Sphingomicrobium sp.]